MVDNNTQFFKTQPEKTISVEGILEQVYLALKEKGYNPVNQIVGYIMSGDPTYINLYRIMLNRNLLKRLFQMAG